MNTARLQTLRVHHGYHILPIQAGMQLEIHEKVWEGNNQRIRRFKGLVIKVRKPNHADGSFTIRGKVAGVSIEKIYPLSFLNFSQVLLLDEYKIRRAKLYYLRDKVGKDAKMKSVLTQNERGLDLMKLAKDEIEALHAAYAPAVETSVADAAQEEVSAEQPSEEQSAEDSGTQEETFAETGVEETVHEVAEAPVATEPAQEEATLPEVEPSASVEPEVTAEPVTDEVAADNNTEDDQNVSSEEGTESK